MTLVIMNAKAIRSRMAAPAPNRIPRVRWRAGSDRLASPITTALSPDRTILIQAISPMPSAFETSHSMVLSGYALGKEGLQPRGHTGGNSAVGALNIAEESQCRHNRA